MHESSFHSFDLLDGQGSSPLIIDGSTLSISNLIDVARRKRRVLLSDLIEERLVASRNLVQKIVKEKLNVHAYRKMKTSIEIYYFIRFKF